MSRRKQAKPRALKRKLIYFLFLTLVQFLSKLFIRKFIWKKIRRRSKTNRRKTLHQKVYCIPTTYILHTAIQRYQNKPTYKGFSILNCKSVYTLIQSLYIVRIPMTFFSKCISIYIILWVHKIYIFMYYVYQPTTTTQLSL